MRYWAKVRQPLPEDPGLHQCAVVAMGDLRTGYAPRATLTGETMSHVTSVDYSVWFLGPVIADDWMLIDLRPGGGGSGRGLAVGLVHDRRGHVATYNMDMLMRRSGPAWPAGQDQMSIPASTPRYRSKMSSPSSSAGEPENAIFPWLST